MYGPSASKPTVTQPSEAVAVGEVEKRGAEARREAMDVYKVEAFEDRVNYAASVISKGIVPDTLWPTEAELEAL